MTGNSSDNKQVNIIYIYIILVIDKSKRNNENR